MANPIDAARQAAEARRAALEAARKAAEEAARKAAAEAARKAAAEAARKRAIEVSSKSTNALKKVKAGRDEYSTGRGSALKASGLNATGGNLKADALKTDAPRLTLAGALAAQRKGLGPRASDLRSEVLNDGRENCLEKAIEAAKSDDRILLYANAKAPVGHAVVQRPDGSVVDPSDANRTYASAKDFQKAHPELAAPVAVSDKQAEQIVATPPGEKRDALIRSMGLGSIAERDVAGLGLPSLPSPGDLLSGAGDLLKNGANAAGDLLSAARDRGADMLRSVAEITGGGLERFGGTVDGFIDSVVPQGVQEALDRLPTPIPGAASVLHAGETLEDLGRTVRDLPEFADAISQAASYRARIRSLGPGDSLTMGGNGNLAIEGIVGSASGSVKIQRTEDGAYKMTVSGELGLGVGGPLAEGVAGNASLTAGGEVEFKFADADAAVRGADILMATAATASTGVLGQVADRTGLTERIFGADTGDLGELAAHKRAITLTEGGELAASLTGQAGLSAKFKVAGNAGVRLEFGPDGNVENVVLRAKVTGSAEGSAAEGATGVNGGVKGYAIVEQGFTVPPGTSPVELMGRLGELERKPDAKITLQAEVFGGSSVGASGGGVSASLKDNEGVQAMATFTGDPDKLLESGALDKLVHGDFNGALGAISDTGLTIDLKVEHFTSTGVSADATVGSAGSGGGVGINVEQRDVDDEPVFHFNGSVEDARAELARLISRATGSAEKYLEAVQLA